MNTLNMFLIDHEKETSNDTQLFRLPAAEWHQEEVSAKTCKIPKHLSN